MLRREDAESGGPPARPPDIVIRPPLKARLADLGGTVLQRYICRLVAVTFGPGALIGWPTHHSAKQQQIGHTAGRRKSRPASSATWTRTNGICRRATTARAVPTACEYVSNAQ